MRAVIAQSLVLALLACDEGKTGDILESSEPADTGTANSAPVVAISSHASGDVVDAAESITLQASVEDAEDAATVLSLSWSSNVDGELGLAASTADGLASLSTSGLSLGTHTLTLTATDTDGASGSDSVNIIVNDAPVVSHIAITPETALTTDELTCIWTLWDAYGVISATGEWQVNGGSAGTGESGMTLSGAFESGDDVSCTVRPMDEHTAGLPVTTRITIDSIAPVLTSVTLSPLEVRTNDTLTAEVSTSDEDGDEVSVGYAWFVDGVEVEGETSATLDGALHFDRDQSVHVVATPTDGVHEGEPMSSEAIVVDNTPPTTPEISIETSSDGGVVSSMTSGSSAMTSHETFVCVVTGESTDADGDEVSYAHTWALGGVDYPDTTSTYEVGDTVSSGGGEPGSTWACSVTAHDGTDPSASADVSYVSPCADGDGDGVFGVGCGGTDCDDLEASVYPGAEEICDGLDNDCDGVVDPDTAMDASTWYCDRDGDGYGVDDGTFTPIIACNDPGSAAGMADCSAPHWASNSDDCLDSWPSVSPGADEVCDGWDNNCDGVVDTDAVDQAYFYDDRDNDGWGSDDDGTYHFGCDPSGRWDSRRNSDCDDDNSLVHPGRFETCDGLDNDCDGEIDEDGVTASWLPDVDGDGWGDPDAAVETCPAPSGYISSAYEDCNDADPEVHPYADEICNGEDDDCNGVVDDDAVDADRYYLDADGDGYGYPWSPVLSCEPVPGRVADGGSDCDDDDAQNNPGGTDTPLWERDCDYGTGTSALSSVDQTFEDEEAAAAGSVVAGAGDVDGDGLADVLVGAPGASIFVGSVAGDSTGGVYLVLSSSLGDPTTPMPLNGADYRFAGEAGGDEAGQSTASAGDLDGDGLDDILIGAPMNSEGGTEAGKAYVVLSASLGSTGGRWLSSGADYTMVGASSADNLGQTVGSAGDVDGDDRPEILIGAPSQGAGAGAVMVMRASSLGSSASLDSADADWLLEGEDGADVYAGQSAASAGDVDGDGLADLIIGAPGDGYYESTPGRVHVVLADSLGTAETFALASADYTFVGEAPRDLAGWSVSSAGDYDDDGLDDILIGTPGHRASCRSGTSPCGLVYVVLGASLATVAEGDLSDSNLRIFPSEYLDGVPRLGFSVAHAESLYEEAPHGALLLGAPGPSRESWSGQSFNGRTYVLRHSGEFVEGTTEYASDHAGYRSLRGIYHHLWEDGDFGYGVAGWSAASAGDVNGDGRSDVLVGDPELSQSYLVFSGL